MLGISIKHASILHWKDIHWFSWFDSLHKIFLVSIFMYSQLRSLPSNEEILHHLKADKPTWTQTARPSMCLDTCAFSVHGEQLGGVATVDGEVCRLRKMASNRRAAWLAIHDGAAEEISDLGQPPHDMAVHDGAMGNTRFQSQRRANLTCSCCFWRHN
jgi:hypothetical protein